MGASADLEYEFMIEYVCKWLVKFLFPLDLSHHSEDWAQVI